MRYMLDTNICIYIIKRKPMKVFETFRAMIPGDAGLSAVTFAELQYGVEKSMHRERNQMALAGFLAPLEILPFSDRAAVEYGRIRAALELQGRTIGSCDLFIAAHALSEGLILVTNNTAEFSRVPGLKVEDWSV